MNTGSFDDYPEKLTTEQVGELLSFARQVIAGWVREGKLPARKEPGSNRWRFDRDELIEWVRSYRVVPED